MVDKILWPRELKSIIVEQFWASYANAFKLSHNICICPVRYEKCRESLYTLYNIQCDIVYRTVHALVNFYNMTIVHEYVHSFTRIHECVF